MTAFDSTEFENYKAEAQQKWGNTDVYKEYAEKTKSYSKDNWQGMVDGLNEVLGEFSVCMKNGNEPDSAEAQGLVKCLQNYITETCYTCTKEILAGLAQMYVADERFKNNIDKNGDGTAEFICKAIGIYCAE